MTCNWSTALYLLLGGNRMIMPNHVKVRTIALHMLLGENLCTAHLSGVNF